MAISPISAIGMPIPTLSGTGASGPAPTGSGTSFGDVVTKALDDLDAAHAKADQLAVQAATGDLSAAHDYTIAATEAQLLTQLTVEVRNRAIEAFNDIMRMQV